MTFAGINYIAVLVAAAAAWGFGGVWYRLLAKPWMAAHGFTSEQIRAHHGKGAAPWPLIVSFVADLVMAWMLAGVLGHLGAVTLSNGVISAAFLWFGFVITTLAVNNMFGMRSHRLIAIDGGHWLGALLLMGAIIGAWGV
jgi:Protein of unknown function (DUF1761)